MNRGWMKQALPWCVGVAASASLIAAGMQQVPPLAHAEATSAAGIASAVTPAAEGAASGGPAGLHGFATKPRTAPKISEAEQKASSVPFKQPSQPLQGCQMRFSAVGASFTEANSEELQRDGKPGVWLQQDKVGDRSWAYWASQDPNLVLDGGWALGGQRTSDIADKVQRSWFPVDTRLVVLLGTNNLIQGGDNASARADIERIVRISGLSPDRVFLVQLPPSNVTPGAIAGYNEMLRTTARENGFHLVDANTFLNNGKGGYREGMTTDGIHLTRDNARLVGRSVAAAINATSGCQELPEFMAAAKENDLGKPQGVPRCNLPDGGCVQEFERGALRRSNSTKAAVIPRAVVAAWHEYGGVTALGDPLTDNTCDLPDEACRTRFERGSIVTVGDRTMVVRGAIADAWSTAGGVKGDLGLPRGDEECSVGTCTQSFAGGTVTWSPTAGTSIDS